MIDAGKYNKIINIISVTKSTDADGFPTVVENTILTTYAEVKTNKGFTLIANGADFEKALTRFVIRYPQTPITYEHFVRFNGKAYKIEYLNDYDGNKKELEIQGKEVEIHGTI